MTMAAPMRPNSPSRGPKRARPDHSASASPAREITFTTFNHEDDLPVFLRQSKAEINAKFEHLNAQQLQRLEQARIGTDQDSQWTVDNSPGNRLRNRYLDIRPWEKQRIKLQVPEGTSDYINASPINLSSTSDGSERKYIATQGPKQAGVDHFWQMVWQEASSPAVIVMLTQLAEGFREKCFQYFPEDAESEEMLLSFTDAEGIEHSGTLRAVVNAHDEGSKTTVRKLNLSYNGTTKTIYHLFFLGWPDYGVPEDADRAALLALIKLSRERNEGWKNPRIIHCSAGVGRSGTFIALEHLLDELEQGHLDDFGEGTDDPIFEVVNQLRQQRMTMVQSDLQFAFIYDILAGAYRERRKTLTKDDHTSNVEKVTSATAKLTALGEPSPKAMRLSRGLRKIYQDIRSRSHSRRGREEVGKSPARTGSEPPSAKEKETTETSEVPSVEVTSPAVASNRES